MIRINTQSSIMLQNEKTLYFDPWKLEADAPKADIIFITHDHSDHYSPADIKMILTEQTILVIPEKMLEKVQKDIGIRRAQCYPVVPGETYKVHDMAFETVPAYNRRKPFHRKSMGWCGYVVTCADTRYYVMGDTDATPEAEAVKADVVFAPIGGMFTMNVEQAAQLMSKMKPGKAIPIHYGGIVGKPTDGEAFAQRVQAAGIETEILL